MATGFATQHFYGHALQSTDFETVESTGFIHQPGHAGGLTLNRPSKPSDQLRGQEQRWMRAQFQQVDGTTPTDCYYSELGDLLNLFCSVSTSAVASFVVGSSNKYLEFTDDVGTVTATLAEATYTATALATEIGSKMTTASSGSGNDTITCTYTAATKKFALSSDGTTFDLLWKTGATHGSDNGDTHFGTLIGFDDTADDTGSTSYTADNTAAEVNSHAFTPKDDGAWEGSQANGFTLLDHRGIYTLQGRAMQILSLAFGWPENNPHAPIITPTWLGADLTRIASVTPTFGTDTPGTPDGNLTFAITLNSNTHAAAKFRQLTATINHPAVLRHWPGSSIPVKFNRGEKVTGTVSFTWDENDDDTLSADHDTVWRTAAGTAAITITQTGATIRGTTKEQIILSFPAARPLGATPEAAAGPFDRPFEYATQYDTSGSAAGISVTVQGTQVLAT